MTLEAFLLGLLVLAAVWALSGLVFLWFQAKAFGRRELFATPAGSPRAGALYAFTKGMSPWAKESVREHLPSFTLGVTFHLGILSALVLLAIHALGFSYPPFGEKVGVFLFLSDTVSIRLLPLLLMLGAIGGVSLFVKRLVDPTLRGLSCPDDYVSNLLATLFVALGLYLTFQPSLTWAKYIFYISAMTLFAYLPLGKLRHCLFFFSTRYNLGAFFGRRGCMPPASANHQRFEA